jgi:copper(I)-binding protein
MNRRSLISLALGTALLLGACGSDSSDTTDTTGTTAEPGITVEGAWARTSPMMASAGAAYMTLTSGVDDRLTGVAVDAGIAATVELHETVMAGDMGETTMAGDTAGGMTDDTTGGMTGDTTGSMPVSTEPTMMMQPVDGIDLHAGTAVELKPGGYHIMLLDLVAPLEMGQTFTITLTFEQAGSVEVPVTVGDAAP